MIGGEKFQGFGFLGSNFCFGFRCFMVGVWFLGLGFWFQVSESSLRLHAVPVF